MKTYKSKINTWIALFIFSFLVFVETLMLINQLIISSIIVGAVILVVLNIFLSTFYVIDEKKLKVRAGFFYRKDLLINAIKKVVLTKDATAGPALSLDRINIITNENKSVILSPVNKEEFINDLKKINPFLAIEADPAYQ